MRRARRAVSVTFAAHGTLFGTWATLIPLVKERLRLEPGVLGLALICGAVGGVIAMQLAPRLMRGLGAPLLQRAAMLLGCVMLPMAVLAGGAWQLGGALLLMGAGIGTVDLVMNAQAVQVETRMQRPVMSGLHGLWSLGALSGAGIGALLLTLLPPPWQAFVLAGSAFAAVFLVSRTQLPMQEGERSDADARPRLLLQPVLILTGALMGLAFGVEGALLDWSAIFLREYHHVPKAAAGLGYAAFAGATLSGRLCGDWLRSRLGDRTVLACVGFAGVCLGAAVLSPVTWLTVLGFALTGLALCNAAPILFNVAGRIGADLGSAGSTRAVGGVTTLAYAGGDGDAAAARPGGAAQLPDGGAGAGGMHGGRAGRERLHVAGAACFRFLTAGTPASKPRSTRHVAPRRFAQRRVNYWPSCRGLKPG